MRLQRVGHDLATKQQQKKKTFVIFFLALVVTPQTFMGKSKAIETTISLSSLHQNRGSQKQGGSMSGRHLAMLGDIFVCHNWRASY